MWISKSAYKDMQNQIEELTIQKNSWIKNCEEMEKYYKEAKDEAKRYKELASMLEAEDIDLRFKLKQLLSN